jgi:GT2 family glycosyltransferase
VTDHTETPKAESDIVVSLIIVTHNTAALTEQAVRSVSAACTLSHEIIVVDNGSQDNTAERMHDYPDVRYIYLDRNHGFAHANNLAAQAARGRYLLLVNSDIILFPAGVDRLIAFAQSHASARLWGARNLFADLSLNPTFCWRRITLKSVIFRTFGLSTLFRKSAFFTPEVHATLCRPDPFETDIVTGCLLLIERQFWQALGGFDPAFYFFGDDADLCLRARAAGAKPLIAPFDAAIHLGEGTHLANSQRSVFSIAARIGLVRRHMPGWQGRLSIALIRLGPWLRRVAVPNQRRAREVWQARRTWWDGF